MLTLKFLFLLLSTKIVFSQEVGKSTIDKIGDGLASTHSGIVIARTAFNGIHLVYKYVNPAAEEELKQRLINQQIKILKTEEELILCVAKNAYGKREEDELPFDCNGIAMSFAELAGLVRHDRFRLEFNAIMDDLPPISERQSEKQSENQNMSNTTKVVIGGAIIVGTTGVCLACAPIILPGTIVATKATAITASIKATALVTGAKIAGASLATKTGILAATTTVVETGGTLYEILNKIPTADKVKVTAKVIGVAGKIYEPALYARPYLCENAQEELIRLTNMRAANVSLRDRIKEIHFSHLT